MSEIVEVIRQELMVIAAPGAGETLVVETREVEVMEVAEQGPPGPPGDSQVEEFDTDLALLFEIAMLP